MAGEVNCDFLANEPGDLSFFFSFLEQSNYFLSVK